METALLGLDLSEVLNRLKEMILRKGFIIQTMNNNVVVAYQEGSWFRRPRQVVFEISSLDKNITRIDITAIINSEKSNRQDEEIMEENYASDIYNNFTPAALQTYGIR